MAKFQSLERIAPKISAMRKRFLFRYLRIALLLLMVPLVYLFWEWGGADSLVQTVRPPVAVSPIRVGKPAPDFSIPAERIWARDDFRLSSLEGYPVILHFWATWCGPCLQELPELISLAEKLRPRGFSLVAVAIDDSWATIEKFFAQYPHLQAMTNHMILVLDPNAQVANAYGSARFPETFLINDRMVVDNKFIGAQPWIDPTMEPYLRALQTLN
jgi:thiol-disulfide isomerase/thioredoxin